MPVLSPPRGPGGDRTIRPKWNAAGTSAAGSRCPVLMAGRKTSRANERKPDYWCHPQKDGHPTLYFHGHELISRAEYVGAVGPDDCDPHIGTGKRAKGIVRKTGPRTEREQMKRM